MGQKENPYRDHRFSSIFPFTNRFFLVPFLTHCHIVLYVPALTHCGFICTKLRSVVACFHQQKEKKSLE